MMYGKCPKCSAEHGEKCWDLRFPSKVPWRRILKPHIERPRVDGTTRPRVKGECPECGRQIGITRAGTLYPHSDSKGATTFDGRKLISNDCKGSNKYPKKS